jgi:hypothetical protein
MVVNDFCKQRAEQRERLLLLFQRQRRPYPIIVLLIEERCELPMALIKSHEHLR